MSISRCLNIEEYSSGSNNEMYSLNTHSVSDPMLNPFSDISFIQSYEINNTGM